MLKNVEDICSAAAFFGIGIYKLKWICVDDVGREGRQIYKLKVLTFWISWHLLTRHEIARQLRSSISYQKCFTWHLIPFPTPSTTAVLRLETLTCNPITTISKPPQTTPVLYWISRVRGALCVDHEIHPLESCFSLKSGRVLFCDQFANYPQLSHASQCESHGRSNVGGRRLASPARGSRDPCPCQEKVKGPQGKCPLEKGGFSWRCGPDCCGSTSLASCKLRLSGGRNYCRLMGRFMAACNDCEWKLVRLGSVNGGHGRIFFEAWCRIIGCDLGRNPEQGGGHDRQGTPHDLAREGVVWPWDAHYVDPKASAQSKALKPVWLCLPWFQMILGQAVHKSCFSISAVLMWPVKALRFTCEHPASGKSGQEVSLGSVELVKLLAGSLKWI